MHVAGEAKVAQIVEQVFAEPPGAGQPVNVGFGKLQGFEIIERVGEAGGQQKAAPWRQTPHEKLEHRLFILALVQIGLDHVELVEVGEQWAG